jgi:hypothetical protein
MAAMSCVEGPFGPGFRFRWEEENSRRVFSMDQRPVEFEQRGRLDYRG